VLVGYVESGRRRVFSCYIHCHFGPVHCQLVVCESGALSCHGVMYFVRRHVTSVDVVVQLGKLTVNVLKECAKKLKLKVAATTKKADLIDAISDHFGL